VSWTPEEHAATKRSYKAHPRVLAALAEIERLQARHDTAFFAKLEAELTALREENERLKKLLDEEFPELHAD
jgi:cell shape-determining protein MreC